LVCTCGSNHVWCVMSFDFTSPSDLFSSAEVHGQKGTWNEKVIPAPSLGRCSRETRLCRVLYYQHKPHTRSTAFSRPTTRFWAILYIRAQQPFLTHKYCWTALANRENFLFPSSKFSQTPNSDEETDQSTAMEERTVVEPNSMRKMRTKCMEEYFRIFFTRKNYRFCMGLVYTRLELRSSLI